MRPAIVELSGLQPRDAMSCLHEAGLNFACQKGVARWVTMLDGKRVGDILRLRRGMVLRIDAFALPAQWLLPLLSAWEKAASK